MAAGNRAATPQPLRALGSHVIAALVATVFVTAVKLHLAWTSFFSRVGGGGGGSSSGGNGGEERCPFEVLGLEGGKENNTIEDATKARRKLALKWHPGMFHVLIVHTYNNYIRAMRLSCITAYY